MPFFSGEKFHMIDGAWGTMWRYFAVFEQIGGFDMPQSGEKISEWCSKVMVRPSVVSASLNDYSGRLKKFLKNRNSYVSTLIRV